MPKKGRAKHRRGSCSLQFYFSFLISYLHRFFKLPSHIFALCKWKRVTQHTKVPTPNNYVQYPSISTHQAPIQLISSWKTRSHMTLCSLGSKGGVSHTFISQRRLPFSPDAPAASVPAERGPGRRPSCARILREFSSHPRGAHGTDGGSALSSGQMAPCSRLLSN